MKKLPRWIKYVLYLTADFFSLFFIGLIIYLDRDLPLDLLSSHMILLLSYVLIQMTFFFLADIYQVITTHFSIFDSIKFPNISLIISNNKAYEGLIIFYSGINKNEIKLEKVKKIKFLKNFLLTPSDRKF
jgi:hypothetical protein